MAGLAANPVRIWPSNSSVNLAIAYHEEEIYLHSYCFDGEWMKLLPKGIKFRPTHEELMNYYFNGRVLGYRLFPGIIKCLNIYDYGSQTLSGTTLSSCFLLVTFLLIFVFFYFFLLYSLIKNILQSLLICLKYKLVKIIMRM